MQREEQQEEVNNGEFQALLKQWDYLQTSQQVQADPRKRTGSMRRTSSFRDDNASLAQLVSSCTTQLQKNPDDVQLLVMRGVAFLKQNKLEPCIQDLTRVVVRLDADHLVALYNRGVALSRNQQLDAAIEDFSRVLALDPDHVNAAYARASCYNSKGDFAQAIEDYTVALEKDTQKKAGSAKQASVRTASRTSHGTRRTKNKSKSPSPTKKTSPRGGKSSPHGQHERIATPSHNQPAVSRPGATATALMTEDNSIASQITATYSPKEEHPPQVDQMDDYVQIDSQAASQGLATKSSDRHSPPSEEMQESDTLERPVMGGPWNMVDAETLSPPLRSPVGSDKSRSSPRKTNLSNQCKSSSPSKRSSSSSRQVSKTTDAQHRMTRRALDEVDSSASSSFEASSPKAKTNLAMEYVHIDPGVNVHAQEVNDQGHYELTPIEVQASDTLEGLVMGGVWNLVDSNSPCSPLVSPAGSDDTKSSHNDTSSMGRSRSYSPNKPSLLSCQQMTTTDDSPNEITCTAAKSMDTISLSAQSQSDVDVSVFDLQDAHQTSIPASETNRKAFDDDCASQHEVVPVEMQESETLEQPVVGGRLIITNSNTSQYPLVSPVGADKMKNSRRKTKSRKRSSSPSKRSSPLDEPKPNSMLSPDQSIHTNSDVDAFITSNPTSALDTTSTSASNEHSGPRHVLSAECVQIDCETNTTCISDGIQEREQTPGKMQASESLEEPTGVTMNTKMDTETSFSSGALNPKATARSARKTTSNRNSSPSKKTRQQHRVFAELSNQTVNHMADANDCEVPEVSTMGTGGGDGVSSQTGEQVGVAPERLNQTAIPATDTVEDATSDSAAVTMPEDASVSSQLSSEPRDLDHESRQPHYATSPAAVKPTPCSWQDRSILAARANAIPLRGSSCRQVHKSSPIFPGGRSGGPWSRSMPMAYHHLPFTAPRNDAIRLFWSSLRKLLGNDTRQVLE